MELRAIGDWLLEKDAQAQNALRYYLGPAYEPINALAQFGALMSPGADMMDMAQSSDALMHSPTWKDAGINALGLGAATLGAFIPGTARGIEEAVDDAGDIWRGYHRSNRGIKEFDPSFDGITFFASSPGGATSGASAGANDLAHLAQMPQRTTAATELVADIPLNRIRGFSLKPSEKDWFKALPETVVGDDALTAALHGSPMRHWDDVYQEIPQADGSFVYKKKPMPALTYADAEARGVDVYGYQWPHWGTQTDERKLAEKVRESGMGGFAWQDEGGLSIGVTDQSLIAKPTGIRAYHGSPHDFDKFSLEHIGKGEGAQAYGHGLYFADNEDVARSYRDTLAGTRKPRGVSEWAASDPMGAMWLGDELQKAAASVGQAADRPEAMNMIVNRLAGLDAQTMHPVHDRAQAALDEIVAAVPDDVRAFVKEKFSPSPGRMYEVNINADPADFLDWDAPDWQQPQAVRDMAGRLGLPSEWGGNDFVHAAKKTGTGYAKDLAGAGIPGIKYLDQGSRAAGEGTQNYVVFDDNLISILRKYGLLGMIGGGAAATAASQNYGDGA